MVGIVPGVARGIDQNHGISYRHIFRRHGERASAQGAGAGVVFAGVGIAEVEANVVAVAGKDGAIVKQAAVA